MADEVVDIRRRITEMRNEVSAAIVSNRDVTAASRSVGNRANISFAQPTPEDNGDMKGSDGAAAVPEVRRRLRLNASRRRPQRDPADYTSALRQRMDARRAAARSGSRRQTCFARPRVALVLATT